MKFEEVLDCVKRQLEVCELVYRTGRGEAEMDVLAETFARDLLTDCERHTNAKVIELAFSRHRLRGRFFPTPAHIAAFLPECRVAAAAGDKPEREAGRPRFPVTRRRDLPRIVCAAVKRDPDCMEFMERYRLGDWEFVDNFVFREPDADRETGKKSGGRDENF